MKSYKLTLVLLLTLVPGMSIAQESNCTENLKKSIEKQLPRVIFSYGQNLSSPNEGVVESSLLFILQLTAAFPEKNYAVLEEKIDSLAAQAQSENVRYKAFIVSIFVKNPAWLAEVKIIKVLDKNIFDQENLVYSELVNTMHNKIMKMESSTVAAQKRSHPIKF
ncbi:MAG: hypothetical protein DWQ05_06390 [Calditrichaeota bacterium]|nr:MAG: hypothetical protein DWQ05_06390 [Calditrichota bacterium]